MKKQIAGKGTVCRDPLMLKQSAPTGWNFDVGVAPKEETAATKLAWATSKIGFALCLDVTLKLWVGNFGEKSRRESEILSRVVFRLFFRFYNRLRNFSPRCSTPLHFSLSFRTARARSSHVTDEKYGRHLQPIRTGRWKRGSDWSKLTEAGAFLDLSTETGGNTDIQISSQLQL